MPHRIDIDGISRNLFFLKNMAFASQPFCENFRVDRMNDEDKPFGWGYYLGWLKSSVSEMLIEVSIKFRVLQDFLKNEDFGKAEFEKLEKKAIPDGKVGLYLPSLAALPIREACNKIIHATEVRLTWINTKDEEGAYEYWNGNVILQGEKGSQGWECEVDVICFCIAMERLLDCLSTEVDWHHIYEYDE